MSSMPAESIEVSGSCSYRPLSSARPSHHTDDTKTSFKNPWDSYRVSGTLAHTLSYLKGARQLWKEGRKKGKSELNEGLPDIRIPSWGYMSPPDKIKATWLGHACFLVELPQPPGASRGARILFDPVFVDKCAPTQLLGPGRFTPTPCTAEQLPEVDVIVISHGHYDHLDTTTLKRIARSQEGIHIFAPLRNSELFEEYFPKEHIHSLDWWEYKNVTLKLVQGSGSTTRLVSTSFRITCTPSQHISARGLSDRFHRLWSSWAVELLDEKTKVKVWFAGDTGYRTVKDGENEDNVPVCPAFKQIGELFGGFDLAMIPIGAYLPREVTSPVHLAPQDSVRVFRDINARRAVGMHWGTWALTAEPTMEPPLKLREECRKLGISDNEFTVCDIGETLLV